MFWEYSGHISSFNHDTDNRNKQYGYDFDYKRSYSWHKFYEGKFIVEVEEELKKYKASDFKVGDKVWIRDDATSVISDWNEAKVTDAESDYLGVSFRRRSGWWLCEEDGVLMSNSIYGDPVQKEDLREEYTHTSTDIGMNNWGEHSFLASSLYNMRRKFIDNEESTNKSIIKTIKEKTMNIKKKVKELGMSQKEKDYRLTGIKDECGDYTCEGKEAFIEWQMKSEKKKFYDEVVKPLADNMREEK